MFRFDGHAFIESHENKTKTSPVNTGLVLRKNNSQTQGNIQSNIPTSSNMSLITSVG